MYNIEKNRINMFLLLLLATFIHSKSSGDTELYTHIFLKNVDTISYSYDRTKTLNSFCAILYELKKHYDFDEKLIYYGVKTNRPIGFFVYDLSDTLNNSKNGIVNFKEGHIYHFAPRDLYFSYSNFCFLLNGNLVFFKAVNCKKPINTINEVISFLENHLPNTVDSKGVIKRVSNYKHYGSYGYNDLSICKCEW